MGEWNLKVDYFLNLSMFYIKRLYIFFSALALIIFFFSTEAVKAKSFEINDIEIAQPFEINFDKNKIIDLGFKKAFFELVYSLIKSSDFKKMLQSSSSSIVVGIVGNPLSNKFFI